MQTERVRNAPAGLLDQLGQLVEHFDQDAQQEARRENQQKQLGQTARAIMLHSAVLTACRAAGVEQLAHQVTRTTAAGMWEHVVELVDVEWELPGYRTVTLTLANWPRKTHLLTVADCGFWHWKPAEDETGGECPSWWAVDAMGHDMGCDSLAEALSIAKVRGGQEASFPEGTVFK